MLMYIFPSGHILQGVILDFYSTGHMRQIYPDGTYIEGDWLRGGFTGYGVKSVHHKQRNPETFTRKIFDQEPAQIAKYKGQFKIGQRHGPGVQTYPNGAKVTGTWFNDRVLGVTELLCSDGTVVKK